MRVQTKQNILTNHLILIGLFNIETRNACIIYSSDNSILIDYRVHSNQVRSQFSRI